jgi:triosephosphate isomerase
MHSVIGGNWKMKLGIEDSIESANGLLSSIQHMNLSNMEVFVAPSFVSLRDVASILKGSPIKLAAQNVSQFESGGYTGEISPIWLKSLGCEYVILGHSERRRIFGESSDLVNKKIFNSLKHGLKPVLCVGETAEERASGRKEDVNIEQLKTSLKGIPREHILEIIIAYEPVWAINSRALNPVGDIHSATPKQAEEMHRLIRKWLTLNYGEIGNQICLQYGGSVNPENAQSLLSIPDINGALVGTASLDPIEFSHIIQSKP